MTSQIIRSVFLDELDRNKRLISRYEDEIKKLPKGSIFKRKKGNSEYFYLNFRNGTKVISQFLGKTDNYDIMDLQNKIKYRNELVQLVKKLKVEKKELEKVLKC